MSPPKIGLQAVMEMTGFNRGFKAYDKAVNKMDKETEGASSRMSGVFKALGKGVAGFGLGAAAGIAGVGAAALKLATDAAPLQGVGDAFRGLGGDIEALREGSLGLATDAELMKSFNSAAQLVSKDFAQTLPDAMQFLSKVSASTGEDMNFMIDSLVKGVGRLSGPILDNLGIQVQLSEFTARAAEMFGKQADELSKAETQAGAMNVVLEKLRANTADMPDVTENAATKMGQLETKLANVKDEMGLVIAEALPPLLDALSVLVDDVGPDLIEWAADAVGFMGDLVIAFGEWEQTLKDIGVISDEEIQNLNELEISTENLAKVAISSINPLRGLAQAREQVNKIYGEEIGLLGGLERAWGTITARLTEASPTLGKILSWAEAITGASEGWAQGITGVAESTDGLSEAMEIAFGRAEVSIEAFAAFTAALALFNAETATAADNLGRIAQVDLGPGFAPEPGSLEALQQDVTSTLVRIDEEVVLFTNDMQAAWQVAFSSEAVQEALGGIQSVMLDHANKMAAITESGVEKTREVDFNAGLKRQIAQAEFSAKQLQADAEFQAKRAIIEADGDQKALAQLENAHARETAQNETAFAEGQARSTFNEAIQQQIRERSQIVQQITQQKAFIAELQNQKEFIRATLQTAVIKAQEAGKISKAEATTILRVVGTGQREQLKNQQLFTVDATQLANQWANGQIGAAKSTILAYKNVQKALDGQIDAALIGLEDLDQQLQDFEIQLPELTLPELPSIPDIDLGVGAAAGAAATESAERVVSSIVSSMARAIEDAGAAIKDIVGFEIPEGFDEGLDNMALAMIQMALKFNAIWTEFQTEIAATAAVAPGVQVMADTFSALAKAVNEITADDPFEEGGFSVAVDRHIERMKEVSGKIFAWLEEINEETRGQVALAGPVAKNVKALFTLIGVDLSKIAGFDTGEGQKWIDDLDNYIWALKQVSGRIFGWLQEIDEDTRDDVKLAAPVAKNVKELFSLLGPDLGKVEDFSAKADWLDNLDGYIESLKLTSGKIFGWMQEIDETTRDQVALAAPVAKNVKELFALIGPDLTKIVPAKAGFEAKVDLFFSQMRFVGVKIMGWLQEIDEQSQLALAAAVPVAENIGKLFGGVGKAISTVVDLAGLKDFEGVNMDVWQIIKSDIQTLLTDISAWELSVDDDAIDSVIGKLGKLSNVVTNLSDIVIGINDIANVGGLDISAARGIMAQFNQLLAPGPAFTGPFQGLSEPAGTINPPAVPFTPAPAGGGSMGTISITGKFEGPSGEFITFVKEFILGTQTDIILGDVGAPDYAV